MNLQARHPRNIQLGAKMQRCEALSWELEPTQFINYKSQKSQNGLTLIELMIGLAIMGILITSVGPMVRNIIVDNSSIAQINELSSIVQTARHHAINEQNNTTLCPTDDFSTCSNNWELPKMVFMDDNNNGSRDAAEEILAGAGNSDSNFTLNGPANTIRFQGNGATATPSTLLLCHASKEAQFARALTVSLQGRVKLSQDSNNDGIDEDNSGAPLSCS